MLLAKKKPSQVQGELGVFMEDIITSVSISISIIIMIISMISSSSSSNDNSNSTMFEI